MLECSPQVRRLSQHLRKLVLQTSHNKPKASQHPITLIEKSHTGLGPARRHPAPARYDLTSALPPPVTNRSSPGVRRTPRKKQG